jgi:hypothetical protein
MCVFRMVTNVGRLVSTRVFSDETHMTVVPLNYYGGIQMVYGRGRSIFEAVSEQ